MPLLVKFLKHHFQRLLPFTEIIKVCVIIRYCNTTKIEARFFMHNIEIQSKMEFFANMINGLKS